MIADKRSNSDMTDVLRTLNTDVWATLNVKAEGEAEEKSESCAQGEGFLTSPKAPFVVHQNYWSRQELEESSNHATS